MAPSEFAEINEPNAIIHIDPGRAKRIMHAVADHRELRVLQATERMPGRRKIPDQPAGGGKFATNRIDALSSSSWKCGRT